MQRGLDETEVGLFVRSGGESLEGGDAAYCLCTYHFHHETGSVRWGTWQLQLGRWLVVWAAHAWCSCGSGHLDLIPSSWRTPATLSCQTQKSGEIVITRAYYNKQDMGGGGSPSVSPTAGFNSLLQLKYHSQQTLFFLHNFRVLTFYFCKYRMQ